MDAWNWTKSDGLIVWDGRTKLSSNYKNYCVKFRYIIIMAALQTNLRYVLDECDTNFDIRKVIKIRQPSDFAA